MIEDIIILGLAAFARFAQGNGHAGPGRWLLLPIMLAAAWFGPLDRQPMNSPEMYAIMLMALAGWATVAFGYTKWGNWQYSLVRYSLLPLITTGAAFQLTGETWLLPYLLVGPILTLIYYFVAQHKPQWLKDIVGNRDVAAALAGLTVGTLVLL